MKLRIFLLGVLALPLAISLSACIPTAAYSLSTQDDQLPSTNPFDDQTDKNNVPANYKENELSNSNLALNSIVIFDGTVFVASTEMVADAWFSAGWQISDQPLDTDTHPAPLDCTLYPHAGVLNQWVGGCVGHVQIPRNGAENIAVVFTNQDGVTEMIQVAP